MKPDTDLSEKDQLTESGMRNDSDSVQDSLKYIGVEGSKENLLGSINRYSRVSQVSTEENVDNGLYVRGHINGTQINFLIDSGSTVTLISKQMFDRLGIVSLSVRNKNMSIQGVDGSDIKIYGREQFQIKLGHKKIEHPVIVCNITTDGIIGQDFILKHARHLDFDTLQLILRSGECVQCYACREIDRVCRVIVREGIEIPPQSYTCVRVEIPDNGQLPAIGYVENDKAEDMLKSLHVVEGLVDTHGSNIGIGVVNRSEESIFLHQGKEVASCKSSYMEMTERHRCATVDKRETKPDPTQLPEHLEELLKRSSVHLDKDQTNRLATLLKKYQDIFVTSTDELGCTDKVTHKINTGNAQPIKQAPRRQPMGKRESEKEEVERMLTKGIIEPSNSEWSSPVVLITKKDGSTRFCVDYRKLNSVTKVDAYPIPRVDDCLEALSGNTWFSSMDLCSGFWQVKMDDNDKHKTAFSTSSYGLYHFKVMPFGLVNSPATFQRLMENVLRGIQWVESLLYMDDIITPGKTVDESLTRLENVFQRLQEANLKLKASKCFFFQKSITFLGHVVSEEGISTDENKIIAVKEWPVPVNAKQVRSFLGLTGYYRKFVRGYSEIAKPLHKLSEKKAKFVWTDDCQNAFERLKSALTTAPILAYPKPECPFILDTDSSNVSTGAVLSQIIDGKEHVIAYMSKTMNKHEMQYCITRKELLAVVKALKHFHHYLYGREFLLRTDNAAVSWLRNLKTPTGQTARWLQELGTYNLKVTHRPGRSHSNADAMSRKPCNTCARQQELTETDECDITLENQDEVEASVRLITRNDLAKAANSQLTNNQWLLDGWSISDIHSAQMNDRNIAPILSAKVSNSERPNWSNVSGGEAELKTLWRQWDRLDVKCDMLYRKFHVDMQTCIWQLVVPKSKRKEVFRFYHDTTTAGHFGYEKTLDKIRQTFYWPGITDDTRDYCKNCDICTARNLSKSQNKAPLGNYLVGEPMERVMMDILGPLPTTDNGNKYVLVIVDWFTKWTESIPLPNQEAKTVADAFVQNFVCRFGVPLQLYTDQGSNFESLLFAEMCSIFDIEKVHATSMRPQANGCVERFNRTLVSMISKYCQENQSQWDVLLPMLMMAYRSSTHSSTKVTPNKMVFGKEVTLPMAAVVGFPTKEANGNLSVEKYVHELRKNLVKVHSFARDNIGRSSEYQKRHYDTNAKPRKYKAGQCVWLHDPTRRKGICSKLISKWKGPYLVTKVLDDMICLVKRSKSMKPKAFHIDRLWPYSGENIPKWITREISRA